MRQPFAVWTLLILGVSAVSAFAVPNHYRWMQVPQDGRYICAEFDSKGDFLGQADSFRLCPGQSKHKWIRLSNGHYICAEYTAMGDFYGQAEFSQCPSE